MWPQSYHPHGESTAVSAVVAAIPLFAVLLLLGIGRKPVWLASLLGLSIALIVATAWYGMPPGLAFSSAEYGAAFGLFPIGWIVFWAILLYRMTVETGRFEVIKDFMGSLTPDHRVQALLIAFAFGAFLEGAAGFGTPVAVAAAMLGGLGFSPFYAAAICLLANTSPVAFGSIGIPIVTLQGTTGLPLFGLSSDIGRICAPVSLLIPMYLVVVMSGLRGLAGVWPAAATCGIAFAGSQFLISNFVGPYLTDIVGSLCAILALIALLRVWHPAEHFHVEHHTAAQSYRRHSVPEVIGAWLPYGLLVLFVLLWGLGGVKAFLDQATMKFLWPGLHNVVVRTAPVVARNSPYSAVYTFNFFTASGTACMFAVFASAVVLRISARRFVGMFLATARQLAFPMLTIASVLALAFVMNYSGATTSLGLAFAAGGVMFPFFSPLLGWLGVFLTGSDTSANALFGNLQVVTANTLHLNPLLMAASNSSGGVVGKMISLQSIAVAAAATEMPAADESKLFRFTLRHSVVLVFVVGLITLVYAYVAPSLVR